MFCGFFSHQLEGADPSSYEAYPRVVEPAPRPSEGPGSAVVRARLDTGFLGTLSDSLCSAEGHRDPRDLFWRGGGAYCPLRSLLHTHFCSRPRFFFFVSFFRPLGPAAPLIARRSGRATAPRIPRNSPRTLRNTHQRSPPPAPPLQIFCGMRGKCCPFFWGTCFGDSLRLFCFVPELSLS